MNNSDKVQKEIRSAIRQLREACKNALEVHDETSSFFLMVGALSASFDNMKEKLAAAQPFIQELFEQDQFYFLSAYSFLY